MIKPTYGCHNRAPFRPAFFAQDGTVVRHVMTTACQYRKTELGKVDDRCAGCRWREEKAAS